MRYSYQTTGTCSREISFDINDGIVTNVEFVGGCNGNLKTIASLVEGYDVDEIIDRCQGITCGTRPTSCGDQFARALKEAKAKEAAMH